MKSFSLIWLLFVVFGVIIDNPVLAKQICPCSREEYTITAGDACMGKLHCYVWWSFYYCEVTKDRNMAFETCCKDAGQTVSGISCHDISDNPWITGRPPSRRRTDAIAS